MNTIIEIDRYIAKSAEFAIPILTHLRKVIHQADARIEEKIKWGMPFFDCKGPVCNFAAFKKHCTFGFWKASLMDDPIKLFEESKDAMGSLGQIKSLADLPSDEVLIAYIQQAIKLNEEGKKVSPKTKSTEKKELNVPEDLAAAFKNNQAALETFSNFSYTNKKEYLEWLTEAKTAETRAKRLETAIDQMAEGKSRHWKYAKK